MGNQGLRDPRVVAVIWDVTSCPAPGYELLFGFLDDIESYELAGEKCGLGPTGAYQWLGVPPGDLWFIVVAHDGEDTEGSWGVDSNGAQRLGTSATGSCGNTVRDSEGICSAGP